MPAAVTAQYVAVMAGGSGTRFWPASRASRPKQFLAIGGEKSLLRQTADRVVEMVGWDHLLVITAQVHAEHAKRELPELPPDNLLIEPVGRNTAPCIAWATRVVLSREPKARLAVLPADHFIADAAAFRTHLRAALAAATDRVVLLGLVPTRPETGYGYIHKGQVEREIEGRSFHRVARFVEKPDRATAERYLAEGDYLWNSGMFVFPVEVMDREIRTFLPALAAGLDHLEEGEDIRALYPVLPSISIDYGVMEKTKDVWVLPSTFPWSDVGSWDAAMDVYARDEEGNVVLGDAVLSEVRRSLVDARSGRIVALVDVDDLIVVDSPDALLVVPRGKSQEVRRIVEALGARGRKELL
jgi:mannose-1-phosphate guanylyltransferase